MTGVQSATVQVPGLPGFEEPKRIIMGAAQMRAAELVLLPWLRKEGHLSPQWRSVADVQAWLPATFGTFIAWAALKHQHGLTLPWEEFCTLEVMDVDTEQDGQEDGNPTGAGTSDT